MYGRENRFGEKLEVMLEAAARAAGVEPTESNKNDIREAFWIALQDQYDREDIELWLDVHEYVYTDDDIDAILEYYRDQFDIDRSLMDNIAAAYYYADLHLKKVDGTSEEEED